MRLWTPNFSGLGPCKFLLVGITPSLGHITISGDNTIIALLDLITDFIVKKQHRTVVTFHQDSPLPTTLSVSLSLNTGYCTSGTPFKTFTSDTSDKMALQKIITYQRHLIPWNTIFKKIMAGFIRSHHWIFPSASWIYSIAHIPFMSHLIFNYSFCLSHSITSHTLKRHPSHSSWFNHTKNIWWSV